MSDNQASQNPFYAITVGSTIKEANFSFGATVLNDGLTKFAAGGAGEMSISGTSNYLYSDLMNQGSVGVSGSYGFGGVSKVSGGVKGYVGHSKADDSKKTTISANLTTWAGIEYVDFNNLSVAELMNGLNASQGAILHTALDRFSDLQKLEHNGDLDHSAVDVQQAVSAWIAACTAFENSAGTGVVVGVLWGAFGRVDLDMHSKGDDSKWNYGGSANFEYSGVGGSVAVEAAYGGAQSSMAKNMTTNVSSSYSGNSVKAEVSALFNKFSDMANDEHKDIGKAVISRGGDLPTDTSIPSVPAFVAPKKEKKVTDLFDRLKDGNGLGAYAKAAAYDKYKAKGGKKDLNTFLKSIGKKNDVAGIGKEAQNPKADLPPKEKMDDVRAGLAVVSRSAASLVDSTQNAISEGGTAPSISQSGDFTPMGIWVTSWAHLFPWLVSAHDNRIPEGSNAGNVTIRTRTFIQDCRSIAQIYARVIDAGVTIEEVNLSEIQRSFVHAEQQAAKLLNETDARKAQKQLNDAVEGLSKSAGSVYDIWCQSPLMRKFELGGGLFAVALDSNGFASKNEYGTMAGLTRPIVTIFPNFQGGKVISEPIYLTESVIRYAKSGFEPHSEPPNTTAFAPFLKGVPLPLPGRKIAMFVSAGDKKSSGILVRAPNHAPLPNKFPDMIVKKVAGLGQPINEGGFRTSSHSQPIYFEADQNELRALGWATKKQEYLGDIPGAIDNVEYRFQPIPFSAAEGIDDWKFGSVTTGMGTLGKQLDALREMLQALPAWSLESDRWDAFDYDAGALSLRTISPSYVGLTAEPKNVFG